MITYRAWKSRAMGLAVLLLAACGGGGEQPAQPLAVERNQALTVPKSHAAAVAGEARVKTSTYIVELAEPPVASYNGGIAGHVATRPTRGQKINMDDAGVARYREHLSARQDAVLKSVGGGAKLHSYGFVFNGFAAELTDAQVQKLATTPGIVAISKDEMRQLDTSSTPTFIGLTGREGFWKETGATGEDVIIGMVDSGIWPEQASFSDRHRGERVYDRIRGWKGICQTGEEFKASDCNRKLIGARYYNSGFGGNAGVDLKFPEEFNSPRDWAGHGTHTSSTAGGNFGVQPTGPAATFGKISGIAPRARIAVYKVCWSDTAHGGGCSGADSVAAIDQAVADGVDVINYSISGTSTNFRDPVEIAFLRAADAGVFVAASAGNSGPATSTVAHPSPWLTTVAAGTHNRDGIGSTTLGNGVTLNGASVAALVASTPLVTAEFAGLPGATAAAARLCFSADDNAGAPVLDPAKVAGKIVVCDRGTNGRTSKSNAVLQAGGVGMILLNTTVNSINADLHFVPTVHLPVTDRDAVRAYAATVGSTASIAQSTIVFTAPAPFTASFSSRGPLLAAGGDLLKPDLIAPGQDILAAVAPPANNGRLFDIFSGTSMSSPHVAGLGALMKELHPNWSPMAIKSALMTTAGDVLDGPNTDATVIFRQGAGHVRPLAAADPGLVFDSNVDDWLGFLCGTQLPVSFCTDAGVPVLDASDLNVPSIAIGDMAGVQTVRRKVTNVGRGFATYTPSVTGMVGFNVVVHPASFTLARGQTKDFTVTFTRTTAALSDYTGGQLTLSGGTTMRHAEHHTVRIPMVVRPVAMAVPAEVSGSYSVTFGYAGPFTATPRGLVAAQTGVGSLATDGFKDFVVNVPAGTTLARFSTFDANVSQASDLDIEVRNSAGVLVGSSGGSTAQEEVNLVNPPAGAYTVRVIAFAVPVGTADFTLFSWALGSTSAGNMAVTAPAAATVGGIGAIGLSFSGLTAGTKYLGSVVYGPDAGLPSPTIVRVDP